MVPLASLPESSETRRQAFQVLRAGLSGAGGFTTRPPLESLLSSGVPALDRLLGGGFPHGMLVVLEGGAGRWSIAARLIAQVTRRGLAAVIDDGALYPPSLARAGARLDRVLVVSASVPLGIARAADILIRSRACRLVVLPAVVLRDAVWMRLASLAHRAGVLVIAVAARAGAALGAACGLRIRCILERVVVAGSRGLWCSFAGFELRAELSKHKRSASTAHARVRAVDALDGASVRERILESIEGGRRAALR